MSKVKKVFAFACWIKDLSDIGQATIINAWSHGQAKSWYKSHIADCCPDLSYTDIRVRKIGGPVSDKDFIKNAIYRGHPEVRCGDRVSCGNLGEGTIVGHNSSANFDVLFDTGLISNCHPQSVKLLSNERAA